MARYENDDALRDELGKRLRRSFTSEEWEQVEPDWSGPYDDQDLEQLLQAARERLPERPRRSSEETSRKYRMTHVRRAAAQAREMVEDSREAIFGGRAPPFPDSAAEAAEWIEARVEVPSQRLVLEVTVPKPLSHIEALTWLRDRLNEHIADLPPIIDHDDARIFRQVLDDCDFIQKIGLTQLLLTYLGINPQGDWGIKRVPAPDGTVLGRLRGHAEQLAKALNWKDIAAVHQMLTGGLMAGPGVAVIPRYRSGRRVFGDNSGITLNIPDPGSITEREVVERFREGGSDAGKLSRNPPRRRGRASARSEMVLALVEATTTMSWAERFNQWNRQYPDDRYRTEGALKAAYYRARLR